MHDRMAIQAVLDGDTEAYQALVERYHVGLIRYVFGLVGDEEAAHDIAQEAFITAYQKLRQYNAKYAFSTWLYRIARNLAYQDMKYHQAWAPYNEQTQADNTDDQMAEQLDKQLVGEHIRHAMGKLRPEWRSAIQLYYWEDKSYEEIADLLGAPVNTVRVWLNRAKAALRSELA